MAEVLIATRIMTGDVTLIDGALVVGDTRVDWAGPAADLPVEFAVLPRTEYLAATIMPGLIDCHVHLGFDGGPAPAARMQSETNEQQIVLMLRSARELLGVGVTTARDLGARSYLSVVVRDAIATGVARGPRLLVAASPITVTGGHCWFMGGEADSEDDLRRMVRTHHKHGADLIKVMSTGGFMTAGSAPWYAQFTVGQLAAVVDEASRLDMPVAAHAHGLEGIDRAVQAGVSTLEHCSFVTETNERVFSAPLAARIAEQGIIVCPTVNVNAPYIEKRLARRVGRDLRPMREMGVRLIAGTDAGINNTPHHQYIGGLEHLVAVGFQPAEVLAMATTEAADALGLGATTGRLAPGYDADIIVVDGDPAADISALGRLRRVIARGRDYVPDTGRFDVSQPGTPLASDELAASIEFPSEAVSVPRVRRNGAKLPVSTAAQASQAATAGQRR
ncbi:MAG TPA: amidohydrolase family protein [Streptosporangiaceae bacterium]|nr:amidohydrolase family protein [Streptosporangiaceae bacterium]